MHILTVIFYLGHIRKELYYEKENLETIILHSYRLFTGWMCRDRRKHHTV